MMARVGLFILSGHLDELNRKVADGRGGRQSRGQSWGAAIRLRLTSSVARSYGATRAARQAGVPWGVLFLG